MMEGKLLLRYIDDTRRILQMWIRHPYIICVVIDLDGIMYDLIIDEHDEYI